MINLMPLILFGAPLIWVWRDLDRPNSTETSASTRRSVLVSISVFFAAMGVVIAAGFDTGLFSWWYERLASEQFSGVLPDQARRLVRFFMGPIGGCIAAQFALLAALTQHALETDRSGVRRVFVTSVGAWFVIDSVSGLLHHGHFNVLLVNVVTIAALVPPLVLATKASASGS
jgi:hypothetical protein